ncbi:MAG: hypothetical protein JO130_06490 [Solirubrobacterales bacterium]|nr:hypothetical protein [Solirubrobacterales bacterium]
MLRRGGLAVARSIARPFGYLAFVLALASLSAAAKLLGNRDELGYFTDRLASTLWRYPEVTRRGVQMAWGVWAVAFVVAISPYDPLTTSSWDEAALAAVALAVIWRRIVAAHRAER